MQGSLKEEQESVEDCLFAEHIMLYPQVIAQGGLVLVLTTAVLTTDSKGLLLMLMSDVPRYRSLVDPFLTVLALNFPRL